MNKEEKEVNIEKYENIIDNMYQEKMNNRIEKTWRMTFIHLGEKVEFTKLEEASVIVLREELRLKNLVEKQQKEIEGKEALIDNYMHNEKVYQDLINNSISINTIKEKIQELKEIINRMDLEDIGRMLREEQIFILQEILEENTIKNETGKM